jgi:hypothetical protein
VGTGTSSSASVTGPAIVLPTLELQAFLPDEHSIDITLPITNIAVVSALGVVSFGASSGESVGESRGLG